MVDVLFREPNSIILSKKNGWSLVVDKGELKVAVPASDGKFLFSEDGAGVKPLVFVGRFSDILENLIKNRSKIISNRIEDLPSIFMSASFYRPGERFEGIVSVHDVIKKLTHACLPFVPGGTVVDLLSNGQTFISTILNIFHRKEKKDKIPSDLLYIKISYMQESEKDIKIGVKETSFQSVLFHLCGIKETPV